MRMIDLSKRYITHSGEIVTGLKVYKPHKAYIEGSIGPRTRLWYLDGSYARGENHELDLIQVPVLDRRTFGTGETAVEAGCGVVYVDGNEHKFFATCRARELVENLTAAIKHSEAYYKSVQERESADES
jgi:hypothetical protein